MPLTRNLYELDEVVSALQTCLRLRFPGLFWLCELVLSLEYAEAHRILMDSWLLYGGGWDPTLVSLPMITNENPKAWITLYMRVANAIQNAKQQNAANLLRQEGSRPESDTRAPLVKISGAAFLKSVGDSIPSEEAIQWLQNIFTAVHRKHEEDAMWLLQAAQAFMSPDAIWTGLRHIAPLSHVPVLQMLKAAATAEPRSQILFQAAALFSFIAPDELKSTEDQDEDKGKMKRLQPKRSKLTAYEPATILYERDWAIWTAQQGRRFARRRDIPKEALHTGTTRGSMSHRYSTIDELRYPVPLLHEGTRFWREAIAAAGLNIDAETGAEKFPSDEAHEAAFQHWFPDDIPDEWSRADQQKSHGAGCAETAPEPPPMVWIRDEPMPLRMWRLSIGLAAL
jgi:hypothetical protein